MFYRSAMAKKKKPQAEKPRTDAERRARQCERISRALRVLQCIAGPGRWDVHSLAEELECSQRTVQRVLQTLAMAGVPFKYNPELRAYKTPHNFKFPGITSSTTTSANDLATVRLHAKRLLRDGEQFLDSLRRFCDSFPE